MHYEIKSRLGSGTHGQVWLAKDPETGKQVAIKIIYKPKFPGVSFDKMIARERNIPRILEQGKCHQNISCMIDFIETEDFYQIISEYIPGIDLKKWTLSSSPSILLDIAYELVNAIEYIHSLDVAHRDIKPENIIMRESHPVIIDFGLSCLQNESNDPLILCQNANPHSGTPLYMAPEIVKAKGKLNYFLADVYSLGLVLYYLFNSKTSPVHLTSANPDILYREKTGPHRKSNSGTSIDPLIDRMIQINPHLRPTMKEIKEELASMIKSGFSFINWEKTFFVFNSKARNKFLPSIDDIPIYSDIREKFSLEEIIQDLFTNLLSDLPLDLSIEQSMKTYDYRTTAVPTNTGPDCSLVRTWIGHLDRLEFWISNKKYAVIWESQGQFFIYENQNGNTFLITPDLHYSTYQPFGDINLPILTLEEILILIEINIKKLLT